MKVVTKEIKETSSNFILGGVAGGVGVTAVYPIDLVKTNIQESRVKISAINCLTQTIRANGFSGLFHGLKPQLLGVAPEKAIKLTVNDLLKRTYDNAAPDNSKERYQLVGDIVAGCFAGASQVIFTNPLEIVKIRLQLQSSYNSTLTGMQVAQQLGVKGLYKGSYACLIRDVPFGMIYFPLYSRIKDMLSDESGDSTHWNQLISGVIPGAIAAIVTTPADVVKTRLQAPNSSFKTVQECAKHIVKSESARGFFRGVVPRTLRTAPQFGITLYMYELLNKQLKQR